MLEPGAICCTSDIPWPKVPHIRILGGGVACKIPVEIGKGFATSAISSLASALVTSESFLQAVTKAHVIEVLHKTGLGDVMAISFGRGLVIRLRAGGPGWGKIISLNDPDLRKVSVLAITFRGSWNDTPSMLSSFKDYSVFETLWRRLLRKPDLRFFLRVANIFSKYMGMYPEEMNFVNDLPGVLGTYAKKSVFLAVVKNSKLDDVVTAIRREGIRPKIFRPCTRGITL